MRKNPAFLIIFKTIILLILFLSVSPQTSHAANPKQNSVLFNEDFNDKKLKPSVWEVSQNNGSISLQDGIVTVESSDLNKFPFIQLKKNPFPVDKEFTLTWRMKYLRHGNNWDGFTYGFGKQDGNNFCDALHQSYGSGSLCTALGGLLPNRVILSTAGYKLNPVNDLDWHTYGLNCKPNSATSELKCAMLIDGKFITTWGANQDVVYTNTPKLATLWFGQSGADIPSNSGYFGDWSPFQLDYIKVELTNIPSPYQFYDEFNDSLPDTNLWNLTSNGGSIVESDGYQILGSPSYSVYPFIDAKNNPFENIDANKGYYVAVRFRFDGQANHEIAFATSDGEQPSDQLFFQSPYSNNRNFWMMVNAGDPNNKTFDFGFNGSSVVASKPFDNNWHILKYKREGLVFGGISSIFFDNELIGTSSLNVNVPNNIWYGLTGSTVFGETLNPQLYLDYIHVSAL